MRIRDFHIDGFGHFADRAVGPLPDAVTVFYGPNEAGKSTYLQFVRTVLFGFPSRLSNQHYPPLTGGRHGGRITLIDDAGNPYVLHRIQGRGIGPVTITNGTGQTLDEAALAQLLGHHSKDVFQSIFAFTLDELQSDDLLRDSAVNSQIYSAGIGATTLPAATRALKSDKDELFLKGGNRHKIAQIADEIRDNESRLAGIANNAIEYGSLSSHLEQVQAELQSLNARRKQCQSQLDQQRRLLTAWDDWNDLVTTEQQFDDLPVIKDFPVDGVSRLEALEERVRAASQEYNLAGEGMAKAEAKVSVRVEHETILDWSSGIKAVQEGRKSFNDSVHDLPERLTELSEYQNGLAKTLTDLGSGWDETRLEAFDFSLAVREEILQAQDRIKAAREVLARSESLFTQNEVSLKEATGAVSKAQQNLERAEKPSVDDDRIKQKRNLVRTARSRLDDLKRTSARVSDLQSQLIGVGGGATPSASTARPEVRRVAAIIVAVVSIAFLIAGALLAGAASLIGVIVGLVLLIVAGCLFLTAESPVAAPLRKSLHHTQSESEELQSSLDQDASTLGLEIIDNQSLIVAEESLDAEQATLNKWQRVCVALEESQELVKLRAESTEGSKTVVESARRQVEATLAEWREWLRSHGLRETFTPDTASGLSSAVVLARERVEKVRNSRNRVAAIEKDILEYKELVMPLARQFGVALDDSDPRTITVGADALVELYQDVQRQVGERRTARVELEDAEYQLEKRKTSLQDAEEELGRLLALGGADDSEGFRKRAELNREHVDLEVRRDDTRARLQRLSGPGERLESLQETLRQTDVQGIRNATEAIEDDLKTADTDLQTLSTEQGAIQTELGRLTSEEESSKLRMERNLLLEQIRDHAQEWVKRTLAEQLLEAARHKFERERQPGVVLHAEEFFKDITDGRYRKVYAPLGQQTITVTDDGGRSKEPAQLSRGTREQLFLSLRFGLVRELGERTESLPVVVDEVLVNFDPERALRAASAFVELSQTNQVLVFTCHPATVEHFQEAASRSGAAPPQVIEIG